MSSVRGPLGGVQTSVIPSNQAFDDLREKATTSETEHAQLGGLPGSGPRAPLNRNYAARLFGDPKKFLQGSGY